LRDPENLQSVVCTSGLTTDPRIGGLLRCNVKVGQIEGELQISLVNPGIMRTTGPLTDNVTLQAAAQEALAYIKQVAFNRDS